MNNEVERTRLLADLNIRLSESPVTILLNGKPGKRRWREWRPESAILSSSLTWRLPLTARRWLPPRRFWRNLGELVVLDEVQRVPSLFEILRPLADRPDMPARFLLLGSASL